ncbi:hypothetical protein LCGC14_2929210 [marine sediment metagenome]|uniref:Uncharacterized protein n=1 Tax=marine sediment metagenome TaxID=412755 RepID=A0A0F8Y8A7_9ZZZZ
MTDYAEWLRGQCIYTKMARRSMRKHLERDYCEHCAAAEEFERLSCEDKLKDAVIEAVQAFVDEADREGLLIGCGENYPGEKEGKYGKGIRKALAALAQDPECEVHRYLMPDGKCTCEPASTGRAPND